MAEPATKKRKIFENEKNNRELSLIAMNRYVSAIKTLEVRFYEKKITNEQYKEYHDKLTDFPQYIKKKVDLLEFLYRKRIFNREITRYNTSLITLDQLLKSNMMESIGKFLYSMDDWRRDASFRKSFPKNIEVFITNKYKYFLNKAPYLSTLCWDMFQKLKEELEPLHEISSEDVINYYNNVVEISDKLSKNVKSM